MNTRNLLIASVIGAVVTAVLTNAPIIGFVNCLLCVGFWGSAVLAVWIYKRQTGVLTLGQGVAIGTLTGVLAGLIGLALSFANLAGAASFVNIASPFLSPEDYANAQKELTGPMVLIFNLVGVAVTIAFGALGGLIGGALFKSKPPAA